MVRARVVLVAIVATLALAGMNSLLMAQAVDQTKLDAAFAKLAVYDFGADNGPLIVVTEQAKAVHGKPAQRKALADRLVALLRSGAPYGAKDFACRQLGILGTADEVPALAAFLADEKLSHMARYALERIPCPAAGEALRQSLSKVKGNVLVGVINSLGNRRDAAAVAELTRLLRDPDTAVADAAAAALGKIGPAAAPALEQALHGAAAPIRPALADGCLLAADQLAATGKTAQAIAIYDRLRKVELPRALRVAAARGAILARQADGAAILVEQLKGTDADLFGLALFLVRDARNPGIVKAAAAQLAGLAPDKQVLLLQALADRGDSAALADVLRLTKSGPDPVRAAAILALVKLADAAVVPQLLDTAAAGQGEVAQAAQAALTNLPGKAVDAAVVAAIDNPDAKVRRAAVEVAGQRYIASAVPRLMKATASADQPTRLAAVKALGETASFQDLPALIGLLVHAKTPGDKAAAEAALRTAGVRMPDKDACAQCLAAGLAQAPVEAKAALLRSLGQVGGAKALETVRAAVKDASEPVRDVAVRVLSDWPDAAARGALADIAKSSDNRKHKILALRGFIRSVAESRESAGQKLALAKQAMAMADRDDEKKLVLGALGGVQSAQALAMVVSYLDSPTMKDEAAAAAVAIAQRIAAGRNPAIAQAMTKVMQVTRNQSLQKRAKELLDRTGGK